MPPVRERERRTHIVVVLLGNLGEEGHRVALQLPGAGRQHLQHLLCQPAAVHHCVQPGRRVRARGGARGAGVGREVGSERSWRGRARPVAQWALGQGQAVHAAVNEGPQQRMQRTVLTPAAAVCSPPARPPARPPAPAELAQDELRHGALLLAVPAAKLGQLLQQEASRLGAERGAPGVQRLP